MQSTLTQTNLDTAMKVAWSLYGTPYLWGGADPMAGVDCSGFVIEVLKSVGLLPHHGDWTAQGLYDRFCHVDKPSAGCLVFWSGSNGIRHVELCLNDTLSIGASGGGIATSNLSSAVEHNAFVKVRPIAGRGLIAGYANPFQC